ncbi:protein-methionine sulfoxide oxidase mical2b [Pholidichthys leucotaenia]
MAAVKALQQWCRVQCQGYRDVSITNMTTSFRDGLAFCALIHKHRPDLINFDSLKKEDVYENNKLAFSVAEQQLGIPALLDAEDMVALKVPDRLSILTYVSQYYNYFHGRSPIGGMGGIKRPAEGPTDEPSGKKNQPVVSKVFPSPKPAKENSPPPSSNITRAPPSPKQAKNSTKDVLVEKTHQAGTLSNKCASCTGHVHLVQRQIVDGKLYHRNCAKSLSPTNATTPLWDLPSKTRVSNLAPPSHSSKTSATPPTHTPSRLGLTEKTSTPPSVVSTNSTPPPSRPSSGLSSAAKDSPAASVSKPPGSHGATFTSTTSISPMPTPAPRPSATAVKTLQSKLKFFESDSTTKEEEKKTSSISVDVNKSRSVGGQAVAVVVNVSSTGRKEANESWDRSGDRAKTSVTVEKVKHENGESSKAKASAAAYISKKLAEENNNNNCKPAWTTVELKKPEKPKPETQPQPQSQRQVETPKREMEGVKTRVRLKADPSILGDLKAPEPPKPSLSPSGGSGARAKSPDRGGSRAGSASPNQSVSQNESPSDWRSMLKPVSKEPKPSAHSQPPPKPLRAEGGKSSGFSVEPSAHLSTPSISVTPPPSKSIQNGHKEPVANGTKSEKISKTKPDYIPKEEIMKELQEIEDSLNELEKRGVELEKRLRRSEEEGEDESVTDELMVEWFNLIRNKQVAMRRESELVYVAKTQDLEEEQPSVEQELRRLMEKPEHLKSALDRKREQTLMTKLMEIINDRNAIVEGLDEDRLREEEEDEQLNQLMMNFNIKKTKSKKKSPMSKLFSWGSKKEG